MSGTTDYAAFDKDDIAPVVASHVTVVPVVAKTERVAVVAPSDLPGGYELHCDFQGRQMAVRVPPEGVKEGQQFVADAINVQSGSLDHAIPSGRWRDGCCDFFANGLCHPMLCLTCWCYPLALGQILTRMGLNAMGDEIPRDRRAAQASAFKVVAGVFLLYFVTKRLLGAFVHHTYASKVFPTLSFYYSTGGGTSSYNWPNDYSSGGDQYSYMWPDDDMYNDSEEWNGWWYDDAMYDYSEWNGDDRVNYYSYDGVVDEYYYGDTDFSNLPSEVKNAMYWMWVASCAQDILRFLFWTYMLVLLIRARAYVRRLYSIPEQNCTGCEDCCCSFWLPCCTALQIARHTADYDTHGASCCTETGLPLTAPEVV